MMIGTQKGTLILRNTHFEKGPRTTTQLSSVVVRSTFLDLEEDSWALKVGLNSGALFYRNTKHTPLRKFLDL